MKSYLASTSFDDVRWASACGLLDGVYVSSTVGDDEIATGTARALEIVRVFACPVLVSLGHDDVGLLYREARELTRETDDVTVEYPVSADTMEGLRRAASEGLRVAAGRIVTAAQALLAAKAGAAAVLAHLPAIEARGQNAVAMIGEIRRMFDLQRMECEVVAMHPMTAGQLAACAAAGAEAVILGPTMLREILTPPGAEIGADPLLHPAGAARRPRPV